MRERWMKAGDTSTYKGLLTWFIKTGRKNRMAEVLDVTPTGLKGHIESRNITV